MSESVVRLVRPDEDDPVGNTWARVRDLTVCNKKISIGQSIAILETVKAELLREFLEGIDDA